MLEVCRVEVVVAAVAEAPVSLAALTSLSWQSCRMRPPDLVMMGLATRQRCMPGAENPHWPSMTPLSATSTSCTSRDVERQRVELVDVKRCRAFGIGHREYRSDLCYELYAETPGVRPNAQGVRPGRGGCFAKIALSEPRTAVGVEYAHLHRWTLLLPIIWTMDSLFSSTLTMLESCAVSMTSVLFTVGPVGLQ